MYDPTPQWDCWRGSSDALYDGVGRPSACYFNNNRASVERLVGIDIAYKFKLHFDTGAAADSEKARH